MKSPDPKLEAFVLLFNRKDFFEAHEALEYLWLKETGPRRHFYQGLIQIAASLVHHQRGNASGARQLLQSARRYFDRCPRFQKEYPVQKLITATECCLKGEGDYPVIPAFGGGERY